MAQMGCPGSSKVVISEPFWCHFGIIFECKMCVFDACEQFAVIAVAFASLSVLLLQVLVRALFLSLLLLLPLLLLMWLLPSLLLLLLL